LGWVFLRQEEVLKIHTRMIELFGGRPGIRDEGALASALLAAENRRHYERRGSAAPQCGKAMPYRRNLNPTEAVPRYDEREAQPQIQNRHVPVRHSLTALGSSKAALPIHHWC
jgi:hypothetical protein